MITVPRDIRLTYTDNYGSSWSIWGMLYKRFDKVSMLFYDFNTKLNNKDTYRNRSGIFYVITDEPVEDVVKLFPKTDHRNTWLKKRSYVSGKDECYGSFSDYMRNYKNIVGNYPNTMIIDVDWNSFPTPIIKRVIDIYLKFNMIPKDTDLDMLFDRRLAVINNLCDQPKQRFYMIISHFRMLFEYQHQVDFLVYACEHLGMHPLTALSQGIATYVYSSMNHYLDKHALFKNFLTDSSQNVQLFIKLGAYRFYCMLENTDRQEIIKDMLTNSRGYQFAAAMSKINNDGLCNEDDVLTYDPSQTKDK